MHGKSIAAIIFALVLLPLLSLTFSPFVNSSTKIVVTVPSEHTVTVVCGEGGSVRVGQTDYTGTNSFTVARHSAFALSASPDSEHELVSITSDSICEMTFEGSVATLKKLTKDTEFIVLFREKEHGDVPIVIKIPVTSETNSIAADAVITGDEASVSLDEDEFNEFLGSDGDVGTVTVDVSHVGVDINTVVIPTSTVAAIAEKTNPEGSGASPGMNIVLPQSSVTFDSAALNAIAEQAEGDSVSLHVKEIDAEKLNTNQQAAIGKLSDNDIVLTVTLTSGDTNISDFKGGSVEIKLPYEPRENEDTDTITVWFVSEDGTLEEIPCKYENGYVAFTVYHFSNYLIKPGAVPDYHCLVCDLLGKNINPWCWIVPLSGVAVALLIIFAAVISKKNKKKKAAESQTAESK